MAEYRKVVATNLTEGPKIFNSAPPVTLQAGASSGPVDISPEELVSMKATKIFDIDMQDAPKKSPPKS